MLTHRRHAAAVALASAVTSAVITMPAAEAADDPGAPQGDPYYVYLSSTQQKSIIAGETSAALGAVCITTSGAGCAVSGLLVPEIAPFIGDQQICPNGGTRRILVQNIVPFNPASEEPFVPDIEESHCIPAGGR